MMGLNEDSVLAEIFYFVAKIITAPLPIQDDLYGLNRRLRPVFIEILN
jgi:hypothetical protein